MRYRKILFFYMIALLVGALTGAVGSLFQMAIHTSNVWFSKLQGTLGMLGVPGWIGFPLLTMIMVLGAWFLVNRIAPETSGSGFKKLKVH